MSASPAPRPSAALSAAQGRSRLSLRHLGGGFPHSQGRPRCLFVSMPNDGGRYTPTIRYLPCRRTSTAVLDAGLGHDTSGRGCAGQFCVVADVLFGAGLGKVGDGVIEAVALAEVGGDGDPIPGPGMGAGQCLAADLPVEAHTVRNHLFHYHRSLAVAELTYVEVAIDSVRSFCSLPAEEDVA